MAVDWIKIRVDLLTSPKVVRMSTGLNKDRLHIIGGLFAVWSIFDAHSEDGVLDGYTTETLDKIIFFDGFSKQMESVGWLVVSENSLSVPRFDSHNGKSAKNRAMDSERKRASRKVQYLSEIKQDKNETREEKRREENKDIILDSSLPAIIESKPLAKARVEKGKRLDKAWQLPKDWGNWALEKGLTRDDVIREAEKFRNYWVAKSGQQAAKLDWEATWHNWIIKAIDDRGDKKTYVEKAQDFKDQKALKTHAALLNADDQTLKELGLL